MDLCNIRKPPDVLSTANHFKRKYNPALYSTKVKQGVVYYSADIKFLQ